MSRIARAARDCIFTDHSIRNFVGRASDPLAYGDSPLQTHLRSVVDRISLVDQARARLSEGRPLLEGDELGRDLILDEIALSLGVPLSREDLVAHRSAILVRAVESSRFEEALETYVALSALYLEATTEAGEGVHRAAGQESLTARVNGLILAGRLRHSSGLVLKADDLERLSSKVLKLQKQEGRRGSASGGTRIITKEELQREVERLRVLESEPTHKKLLGAGVERGHALFSRQGRGSKLERAGQGVVRLLDRPETYAMALMAAVAGTFGRIIMSSVGSTAMSAAELHGLRLEKAVTKKAVGQFVASRAVEGAVFLTGMNLFDHVRGKHAWASWRLGDFARSVALFEVLGGVGIWQHARQISNAIFRHAATLGEETLGLSLLGFRCAR